MANRNRGRSFKTPPFDHSSQNDANQPPISIPNSAHLNLWRAIFNELTKINNKTLETQRLLTEAINDNPMSGVLAVYDVDGSRVINDHIAPDQIPDKLNELDKLKAEYENNKTRMMEQNKSIEQIILSLKKLSGDSSDSRKRRMEEEQSVSPPKRGPSVSGKTDPIQSLTVGSQVAFRLNKQRINSEDEEEWIQCVITKVYPDGSRCEVRDPEPDENGNPGQSYRAPYRDIIRIPPEGSNLSSHPVGSKVLARYPETTTFYRAEVMGTKRDGRCRLKFVGEEEENKEQEVERRFVLTIPSYTR